MNLERLVSSRAMRSLVDHAELLALRETLRHTLVPLVAPPWKQAALRRKVERHLALCLPDMAASARRSCSQAYLTNWGRNLAENAIVVNVRSSASFERIVQRYVAVVGSHHVEQALATGRGVLLAGAHTGSVPLGTLGVFRVLLGLPRERRPLIRACAEPSILKFPRLVQACESALGELGLDVELLGTGRDFVRIGEQITQVLRGGGMGTTAIDVLMGGRSRRAFSVLGGPRWRLPGLVGAARSALRAGAPLLPWSSPRVAGGYVVRIEAPIGPLPELGAAALGEPPELEPVCQRLVAHLAAWIRSHPEQWVYWDRLERRLESPEPTPDAVSRS